MFGCMLRIIPSGIPFFSPLMNAQDHPPSQRIPPPKRNNHLCCKTTVIPGHRTFFPVLWLLLYMSKHYVRLECTLKARTTFYRQQVLNIFFIINKCTCILFKILYGSDICIFPEQMNIIYQLKYICLDGVSYYTRQCKI